MDSVHCTKIVFEITHKLASMKSLQPLPTASAPLEYKLTQWQAMTKIILFIPFNPCETNDLQRNGAGDSVSYFEFTDTKCLLQQNAKATSEKHHRL